MYNIYETESGDFVKSISLSGGGVSRVTWCAEVPDAKGYDTQEEAEQDVDALRDWADDKGNGKEFEIIDPDGNAVEY